MHRCHSSSNDIVPMLALNEYVLSSSSADCHVVVRLYAASQKMGSKYSFPIFVTASLTGCSFAMN